MFNFACYGAGTPMYNDYGQRSGAKEREQIADSPFLAALPQRLLSHPRAAPSPRSATSSAPGAPASRGAAAARSRARPPSSPSSSPPCASSSPAPPSAPRSRCFNERYAELASDLSVELEEISFNRAYNALELTDMWTANNDARGYDHTIIGDPAVRLPLAPPGSAMRRPELAPIVLQSAPTPDIVAHRQEKKKETRSAA
jgi:hypothetical protein